MSIMPRPSGTIRSLAMASLAAAAGLIIHPGNIQADPDDAGTRTADSPPPIRAVERGKLKKFHKGDVEIDEQARRLHLVDKMRRLGGPGGLTGLGVTVGVWDEGPVFVEHEQFGGRVRIGDVPGNRDYRRHSTHVAGSIGAAGGFAAREKARGMAPQVSIVSFDWNDDISELRREGQKFLSYKWPKSLDAIRHDTDNRPILVTNHSYGYTLGWVNYAGGWYWEGDPSVSRTEDYRFGRYGKVSRNFDQVVYDFPQLAVFVAAGNDRGEGPRTLAANSAPVDGGKDGYDTLGAMAVAKNAITIGAMEDLPNDWADKDLKVTEFSNFGPADDGRIKPDLVANGRLVFSPTVPPNGAEGACQSPDKKMVDDCYEEMSGTSMGTPAASGIAALLQELAQLKWFSGARERPYLFADEIKAAMIHTARRPSPGPRYDIGWGAINAYAAGRLVAGENGSLRRVKVTGTKAYELKVRRQPSQPLRVTIVWIDKPGTPPPDGRLDDRTRALVHDLDLTVAASDKETLHYPWSLNPLKPGKAATQSGKNSVDNVEQVYVAADPDATSSDGVWTVHVSAAQDYGTIPFALAISGAAPVRQ